MAITPVPKGHLIKKNGNALKTGGKVAKTAAWTRYLKEKILKVVLTKKV